MLVGIDLVEVPRLARMIEESRDPSIFLSMSWTPAELAYCGGDVERLAARWAVKEATFKALGVGIGPLSLLDVEVVSNGARPELALHGGALDIARDLEISEWNVSMSHEGSMAVGIAIATKRGAVT